MTSLESARLLSAFVKAYTKQLGELKAEQVSDMLEAYTVMLSDLDYAAANAAAQKIVATCKWWPSIAEIREATLQITDGEPAPGGSGWGEVRRAIAKFGAYRTPGVDFQFADPIVATVVKWLGWRELCHSQNEVADRARFVEAYDKQATIERKRALAPNTLPALKRFAELQAVRNSLRLLDGGKA